MNMETKRLFCRLNGFIEGSEENIKRFLNGDTNANVKFIATKEGYIPADSIEEFYNESNGEDKDWWADDVDFSVNGTEYTL